MQKKSSKKIKNTTLIALFFLVVGSAILVSLIIKVCILVAQSRFDNTHQFIAAVQEDSNNEELIAFNPSSQTTSIL